MTSHNRGRRRVLFLNWRDLNNPLGGGSERYLHQVAAGLVVRGDQVTVRTASYPGAAPCELLDGVRYLRRGSPNTVFPTALVELANGRLGPVDVIVDCQNGVPFWSRLARQAPVVVLVHHVHREQWRMAVGPAVGRVGWWLESRLAPLLYRGCQYVTVSESTRAELVSLGVRAQHVAVVHNGLGPPPPVTSRRSTTPLLSVVGRLVPHKQVEHALEVTARLLPRHPNLRLALVGSGYWHEMLVRHAEQLGVRQHVDFLGHVDEQTKHEVLASSWLHLCPSVKEGWGLAIVEAAQHAVPTVAYRAAGGTAESVLDRETGLLVDNLDSFTTAVDEILADSTLRRTLAGQARRRAGRYTWDQATESFSQVLDAALRGRPLAGLDPAQRPADLHPAGHRAGQGHRLGDQVGDSQQPAASLGAARPGHSAAPGEGDRGRAGRGRNSSKLDGECRRAGSC